MKTELSKLIDKWEIEKGSYIPNAPIYQAFIDEAKEALERESKVNNVVSDAVMISEAQLKAKLEEQKEGIRQWLIYEDFEGLAERL
jgi:hypothetical protein|tara:strand:- start:241 stop:498 length:258 start_codon:yes stop_codon:yes gene_type:complete